MDNARSQIEDLIQELGNKHMALKVKSQNLSEQKTQPEKKRR